MPTNISPATAIDITSLPYTSPEIDLDGAPMSAYDPSCSTADAGVWWKRTAGASLETIVFLVSDESGGNNFPAVSIWDADLNPLGCANGNVTGSPARSYYGIDIPAGATRYIQVNADGGVDAPAPIILKALYVAPQVIPAGSLCVPSDLNDTPCVILSADDGSLLYMGSWLLTEQGEHLGGVIGVDAWQEPTTAFGFARYPVASRFDPVTVDGLLIGSHRTGGISPVRSDRSSRFFYCRVPDSGAAQLIEVFPDGTTGDSWTLPANSELTEAGAPSRDRTIYYYQDDTGSPIHRYDLVGEAPLSDLIATVGGSGRGRDLLVTADGDILSMYKPAATDWVVQRITAAGSVAATYAVGVSTGSVPRMDFAIGDASIWVMSFPEGAQNYSRFQHIRLSDGAVLTTFDVDHMQLSLRTDELGPAQSCPIIVLHSSIALATALIGSPGPLAWIEARWRTPGSP